MFYSLPNSDIVTTYLEHSSYSKYITLQLSTNMTCHSWTTDNQREWLEAKKSTFIDTKQKGNTALKEFYQDVFREFCEQWPMLPITADEISAAGSTELATKVKCDSYDKVCHHHFHIGRDRLKLT